MVLVKPVLEHMEKKRLMMVAGDLLPEDSSDESSDEVGELAGILDCEVITGEQ